MKPLAVMVMLVVTSKERLTGRLVPPALKKYFKNKSVEEFAIATAKKVFPNPDQEDFRRFYAQDVIFTTEDGYLKAWGAVAGFDSYCYIDRIAVPTLVYYGEKDEVFIQKQALLFKEKILYCVCQSMPGAGHILNLFNANEFNQTVESFLLSGVNI